jgi:hypothetical protein
VPGAISKPSCGAGSKEARTRRPLFIRVSHQNSVRNGLDFQISTGGAIVSCQKGSLAGNDRCSFAQIVPQEWSGSDYMTAIEDLWGERVISCRDRL